MNTIRTLAAATLVAGALLSSSAADSTARAVEDPYVMEINPFKDGLDSWERTGKDKAFTWDREGATLTVKGQSGKEVPVLLYPGFRAEKFEVSLRVKKFARKLKLLLRPSTGAEDVTLEIPKGYVKDAWNEFLLRVASGKAVLLSGEEEAASVDLPADASFRFGFDGSYGGDGVVSDLRIVQRYENPPQFCEEGFTSVFDGATMGPWRPHKPEMEPLFTIDSGLLIGEVRAEDFGMLALVTQKYKAYDFRLRALWGSDYLEVRAVEVPGLGGIVNKMDTIQTKLSDYLRRDGMTDIGIRVENGKCVIVVDGKTVLDVATAEFGETFVSLILTKGKKFLLRDLRIRDLAAGAAPPEPRRDVRPDPGPVDDDAKDGPGKETRAPPPPGWKATPEGSGFTGEGASWECAEAGEDGAALLSEAGRASTYTLRFRAAKGAEGLSLVPRALRDPLRDSGMRLDDALFEGEWNEVQLRMELLTAKVTVNGKSAGSLEVSSAVGPPALRVSPGGSVRIEGLALDTGK